MPFVIVVISVLIRPVSSGHAAWGGQLFHDLLHSSSKLLPDVFPSLRWRHLVNAYEVTAAGAVDVTA